MESQQQDIFDWGVKGIVEGKLVGSLIGRRLTIRCDDWFQWDTVLLWSDRFRKDI